MRLRAWSLVVLGLGVVLALTVNNATGQYPNGGNPYYYCVRHQDCSGISLAACTPMGIFCVDDEIKSCETTAQCRWQMNGVCVGPALATCWSNSEQQTLTLDCIGECRRNTFNDCVCHCGKAGPGSAGVIVIHPDCNSVPFAEMP